MPTNLLLLSPAPRLVASCRFVLLPLCLPRSVLLFKLLLPFLVPSEARRDCCGSVIRCISVMVQEIATSFFQSSELLLQVPCPDYVFC